MLYPEGKKGKKRIADDMVELIESSFGLERGWMDGISQKEEAKPEKNFTYAGPYKPAPKYPVISSVQAGAWAEAIEPYTLDDVAEWLESDAKIQGKAFWLLVDGDSMTAPAGQSVPQGSYVLFDTGREAVNGSLVIAKLSDYNEATFKKLAIEGGQRYLKGLNPNWPIITINGNCKIIGVAVEAKMKFV
ncbi:hypothetical protein JHU04_002473 [Brenneria sp. 4F2]|nr:hypothetical protein [Brenneria bubanii]